MLRWDQEPEVAEWPNIPEEELEPATKKEPEETLFILQRKPVLAIDHQPPVSKQFSTSESNEDTKLTPNSGHKISTPTRTP